MTENKNAGTDNNGMLKKSLTLFDSTAIVIGSMIGSGIFIVSADMARNLGSPGWMVLAWLLSGAMTIIAALSYGELAGMMPRAGGQYVYLREAYNPLVGFLYGWTLFLVIQSGTIAAVAVAFAKFTGVLIPWFSEKNVLLNLGLIKINSTQILAMIMLIIQTIINLNGINTGKFVQNIFTLTKATALLGLIIIGIFFVKNIDAYNLNINILWDASQGSGTDMIHFTGFAVVAALGTAMVGSLFSSDAWNNITFIAGETINPKRNIPLSLFLGTTIVSLLYILANAAYINVLPLRGIEHGATVAERGIQFATDERVGTAFMQVVFGNSGSIIMAILIMISTFGCNNGLILAGARVYYSMAQDGLFFKSAGLLNKNNVPGLALVIQCVWACLLCLSGTYSDLLDYVVFTVLLFYIFTIAGIFILRKKRPDAERPYKAFGYPFIPFIYILAASVIMVILLIYKPNYTWPGLIIVFLGFPVYFIWKKINK
ncbi:MAG: amino acid permease [Ignavibacteriae bacterium]|nr:amino acid permease [Ignavibacteriota bacterium]